MNEDLTTPFEQINPIDYDNIITGLQKENETLKKEKAVLAQALLSIETMIEEHNI